MDRIENVDLREALREIAEINTYFHLENDLGISIEQMERAAKINDYADKTLIWVSYPAGIDCYAEREVFQKDTRGYNGVLYHGGGAEHELKRSYAVDVSGIRDGRVRGSLYEIDIKDYADNVRKNAVATNSIRIYVDDPHGNGEQIIMPKAEFDRRYPLDLVKMAYWRNEPTEPEALKTVLANVWNNDRDGKYKTCSMWEHTTKLYDNRFTFYANQLMESLNKHQYPNSTDRQSFTTSLDGRIAFALNPEQLGRILEALPYKSAVFTVERRALNMNLVVPKDEVLELRHDPAEKTKAEIIGHGETANTTAAINGEIKCFDLVISIEAPYLVGEVNAVDKIGSPEHDGKSITDNVFVDFQAEEYSENRINDITEHFNNLFSEPKKFTDLIQEVDLSNMKVSPKNLIRINESELKMLLESRKNAMEFCNRFTQPKRGNLKNEKPSLLATLEANEQKSKQQFGGQRAESDINSPKKSQKEEL